MKNYRLSNNIQIPAIGLGTWQTTSGEEAINAISTALKNGYRHIDTAAIYGNEKSIGEALQQSNVPRSELFVTSKVWNTNRGYEKAIKAFEKTLADLQLEYLDLYLIHWPANAKQFPGNWQQLNADTWRALEDLYDAGKIKAIGVSNFLPHHLQALLESCRIRPMVNQIEFHPGYMQKEALEFSHAAGLLVEAWSPFGRGKLFGNETLESIASKYGKTVAQVCLRWCLQHQTLPLPKSVTEQRMQQNLAVFDFSLSEEDMALIDGIPHISASNEHPDTVHF